MRVIKLSSFLAVLVLLQSCSLFARENRVCHEDTCFVVEIADTDEKRSQGLQNRKSLGADRGMLFVFPSAQRHRFWMKNTLISLDMIWLDYARRVIHIEAHVPPCKEDPCTSYGPEKTATYVLEINAGLSATHNINVGDVLNFQLSN